MSLFVSKKCERNVKECGRKGKQRGRKRRLTIKIQKIIAYFCAHRCFFSVKPKSKRKQGENEQQTQLSCKWKTMPKCNKINKRQSKGERKETKQKNLHCSVDVICWVSSSLY